MSAAVRILKDGQLVETVDVREPITLGRAEGCVIQLNDHAISRKHVVLSPGEKTGVLKFEKKSEFGWVRHNGQEKLRGEAFPGDIIELGPFQLEVLGSDTPGTQELKASGSVRGELPSPEPQMELQSEEMPESVLIAGVSENRSTETDGGMTASDPSSSPSEIVLESTDQAAQELLSSLSDSGSGSEDASFSSGEPLQSEPEPILSEDGPSLSEASPTAAVGDRTQLFDSDGATRLTPVGRVQARLVFSAGSAAIDQFDLSQAPDRIVIGRGRASDIQLQDKKSSRAHVEVFRQDGKYLIKDLGSANGTFVNRTKVEPNSETALQPGDVVEVGDAQFVFEVVSQDYVEKEQGFLPPSAVDDVPLEGGIELGSAIEPYSGVEPAIDSQWGQGQDPYQTPAGDFPPQDLGGVDLGGLNTASPAQPEPGLKGLLAKYKAIPQQRRRLLLILLAVVVFMGWMGQDTEEANQKAKKKPKPTASVSGMPTALTFDDLSKEMQQKVLQGREDATRHYTSGEFEEALLKAEAVLSILSSDEVAVQIKRYSQIAIQKKKQIDEENARKRQAEERIEKVKTMVAELEAQMNAARGSPDTPTKFDAVADQLANSEIRVLDPENAQIKKWEIEIGEFRQKMMDIESSRVQMVDLRKDFESSLEVAKKAVEKAFAESDPQARLKLLTESLKLLADIRLKEGFASDEATRSKSSESNITIDLKKIAKIISLATNEADRCRTAVDTTLEPHFAAANEAEEGRDFVKAFDLWQKFAVLDDLRVIAFAADGQELSFDAAKNRGRAGMERIRGILNAQAKSIYTEGVLAESYSDFTKARQKFKELLEKAPKDDKSIDGYYERARRKLALYEQFDQANGAASAGGEQAQSANSNRSGEEARTPASPDQFDAGTSSTGESPVPVYDPTSEGTGSSQP